MDNRHHKQVTGCVAAFLTAGLLAPPTVHAATITQTANDGGVGWNSATLWGGSAPASGNDYVTASGLAASSATALGASTNVTGRVRMIAGQTSFGGDSISVSAGTEILGKDAGTYTANVILNGGILRWSPNAGANATMAGTINVAANSVLGSVQSNASIFTISSTITGSSTLRLATGTGTNQTITFDDGAGLSLNEFAGTLDIGGGGTRAIVDFNQAYNMGLAGITMGNHLTADILNLDASITVESFSFGGNSLAAGTYSTTDLNGSFGTGSQFTGTGNLIVIPEPSAALIGGLGLLALLRRRRA